MTYGGSRRHKAWDAAACVVTMSSPLSPKSHAKRRLGASEGGSNPEGFGSTRRAPRYRGRGASSSGCADDVRRDGALPRMRSSWRSDQCEPRSDLDPDRSRIWRGSLEMILVRTLRASATGPRGGVDRTAAGGERQPGVGITRRREKRPKGQPRRRRRVEGVVKMRSGAAGAARLDAPCQR